MLQPDTAEELGDHRIETASAGALDVHTAVIIGSITVSNAVPHDTNAIPSLKADGPVLESSASVISSSLQTCVATSSVDSTDEVVTNHEADVQVDRIDDLARPSLWGAAEQVVGESATAVVECGESVGSVELHLELSDDDMSSEELLTSAQSHSAEESETVLSVISSVHVAGTPTADIPHSEIHLSKSSEASNIVVIADSVAEKERQPVVLPEMQEENTAPLKNRSTSRPASPSKPVSHSVL